MSKDQICTPFELKLFAFSVSGDNPTAFNFARFIETKSGFKYTVIEKQLIIDILEALNKQAIFSNNLYDEFKKKWENYSY